MAAATKPTEVRSCCSTFYEQDWVRLIAENAFHPGGPDMSRRTVTAMGLAPGARLLDLGCGVGSTAKLLAGEMGLEVIGIDASRTNVARAEREAGDAPIAFVQADAHRLPFADRSFDAALGECVLSLFADQAAVLGEIRRVLRPGGRLGITDMAVNAPLPQDFCDAAAGWACLAGALNREAYRRQFEQNGFDVIGIEDETAALDTLIGKLKRRLVLIGTAAVAQGQMPLDVQTVRYWLDRFAGEVGSGAIGYVRFDLACAARV
jgi:arsenite methyltransferase